MFNAPVFKPKVLSGEVIGNGLAGNRGLRDQGDL
jgi:hypothetical protein